MHKNCEMSRIVQVQELTNKPKKMEIEASEDELKAIAERLQIVEVKDLKASLVIEKHNLIQVSGSLSAHVVQACVVSSAPVEETISDSFEEFFGEHKRHAVPVDIDMEAQDVETVENGRIDVGALILEYLVLNLNPYPRKVGLAPVQVVEAEEKPNPFLILQKLKKN